MEARKIKQIEITKLFGYKDIKWTLNDDINILSGINGTGKSTILSIIGELINGISLSYRNILLAEKASIIFDNGTSINYWREKQPKSEIPSKVNSSTSIHSIIFPEADRDLLKDEEGEFYYIGFCNCTTETTLPVSIINTFDQSLSSSEDIKKGAGNHEINTELDLILNNLENNYFRYNAQKNNSLVKELEKSDAKKRNVLLANYLNEQQVFNNTVNHLFEQTEKNILIDKHIEFKHRNMTISPYKLSSGEKQMLIILLKIFLQDKTNSVLIMDEPEISLHFEWQKQLIEVIRKLNPNVQLIIATHSPFIAMNGWLDKITNISDITNNQ